MKVESVEEKLFKWLKKELAGQIQMIEVRACMTNPASSEGQPLCIKVCFDAALEHMSLCEPAVLQEYSGLKVKRVFINYRLLLCSFSGVVAFGKKRFK